MNDVFFFWFMLGCVLVCPLIVFFAGCVMTRMTPGEPNPFIGYRTALSMRNQDTWDFANVDCGRRFRKSALWLALASAAAMLCAYGASGGVLTAVLLIVVGAQVAWLFVVIWAVEKDLRRVFNEDGTRKAHMGHTLQS